MPTLDHHPGRTALVAVLGGGLLLALVPAENAGATYPWQARRVRNADPQQAAGEVDERHPIHYQRNDPQRSEAATALMEDFFDRHTALQYEQAAEVAAKLIELDPERAEAYYNHACVMGRLHRRAEALASLEQAIDRGWRDLVHLSLDPDLAAIRKSDGYQRLEARLQQIEAAKTPPAPPAWPSLVADLYRDAGTLLARSDADGATVAMVHDGRLVWTGSFGRGPAAAATAGTVEAEGLVRVLALGAMLRHSTDDTPEPGSRTVLAAGGEADRDEAGNVSLVQHVERATDEPFVLCCRRHVLDALGLQDTRLASVARGEHTRLRVHSTASDLGRLVAAMSVTNERSEREVRLVEADSVGRLFDLADRLGLEIRDSAVQLVATQGPSVVVRWYPGSGRGVVVVTDGPGGRAAERIADAALGVRINLGTAPAGGRTGG